MRFTVREIRHYYRNLELPEGPWHWNRKHYRIETLGGHWAKLNKRRPRISAETLRQQLIKYVPKHIYMSVMDYLRPEYVGSKKESRNALPIGGALVFDVDSHLRAVGHDHRPDPIWGVCLGCLWKSKLMTLVLCDRLSHDGNENIEIVFSGRRGFHVWLPKWNYRKYARPDPRNPLKAQASARFKYARDLADSFPFDRSHFLLSVDPLRVMTVPNTLNLDTGLVALHIGSPWVLENLSLEQLIRKAQPLAKTMDEPFKASMLWLP